MDWNAKVGSQETPGVTGKFGRAKTDTVLPRKCTGHSKHPLPTTQKRLYKWPSPGDQHLNQIDYIVCGQRWRSSIQSQKQDLGLTVAKT